MATDERLRLQERIPVKNRVQRVSDLFLLSLLLFLLFHRLSSLNSRGSVWLAAFLCECWFTFVWVLNVNAKWSPVIHKTYPEILAKKFDELPAVDMFVTTADPKLEPPIVTVNTVLSLLAVEYPAHKLACYVSDDAGSPVTFYSLSEASKFAKLWVPFCKMYDVRVRAPFVYFSIEPEASGRIYSDEFIKDWKYMKSEYEKLSQRIEDAGKNNVPSHMDGELAEFSNIERGNHQSIIKVIWENKEQDGGTPHLIYVAREKRAKNPHHYKAGAMNVLVMKINLIRIKIRWNNKGGNQHLRASPNRPAFCQNVRRQAPITPQIRLHLCRAVLLAFIYAGPCKKWRSPIII